MILVIAEHDNQTLKPSTLHTCSAAFELGTDVELFVAGHQCQAVAEQAALINGIKRVVVADHPVYQHQLAENMAACIVTLADDVTHIVAPASTFGKNLLPRVAALLDVAQVSEVCRIIDAHTFVRPIYAGNAFAEVQSQQRMQCLTIRYSAFAAAAVGDQSASIQAIDTVIDNTLTRYVGSEHSDSTRPELTAADIVIAGGRGLQNKENFAQLEQIADLLGAAVGASRAAVDAGIVPNEYQVGQTGKIVAPKLYIAIGISGAIQHIAGMKGSKVIVAINKDPDAPIFQVADYGLVADCMDVLPKLRQALQG